MCWNIYGSWSKFLHVEMAILRQKIIYFRRSFANSSFVFRRIVLCLYILAPSLCNMYYMHSNGLVNDRTNNTISIYVFLCNLPQSTAIQKLQVKNTENLPQSNARWKLVDGLGGVCGGVSFIQAFAELSPYFRRSPPMILSSNPHEVWLLQTRRQKTYKKLWLPWLLQ